MPETPEIADIAIVMGSSSDWPTMKNAAEILQNFGVSFAAKVISAHRTPEAMADFAKTARQQGFKLIIAGAGGAAHLPGMLAAQTTLPVIGVPVKSRALSGLDSLYSIVQMPAGVAVATMAIGDAGAKNAALYAIQTLAISDEKLQQKLADYREQAKVMVEASNQDLIF